MKRLWLVRAGRQGEREQLALENKIVTPGFERVADLSKATAIEVLFVGLPRHPVDAGRGIALERVERRSQHRPAACRTRSSACDTLSRSCARRVLC
jgi:hypothetical protein